MVDRDGSFAVKFDPISEQMLLVQAPVILPMTGNEQRICTANFPFLDLIKGSVDGNALRRQVDAGLMGDEIRALQRTPDGRFWIHGRHGSLFLWDPSDPQQPPVQVPFERWRKNDWPLIGPDAVLWLPGVNGRLRPIQLPEAMLEETGLLLHIDDLGETWLSSLNDRLYKIEEGTGSVTDFGPQPGTVQRIHRDREGLAWVATEAGLVCIRPGADLFQAMGNIRREGGGMAVNNSSRGIIKLRNGHHLWFNDLGRVFELTRGKAPEALNMTDPMGKILFIQGLFLSGEGHPWIHARGALHLMDTVRLKVVRTPETPGEIISVHPSSDGKRCLVFLEGGRAVIFDPLHEAFGEPFHLTKALRAAVWFDGDRILLPAPEGIRMYDVHARTQRLVDLGLARPLDENMVRSMEFLGPVLFMGTGAGLLAVDTAMGRIIRTLSYADGLADEVVYSLLAEKDRLWVGTRNGLSLVDTATWDCINYFMEDGLPFNEFNAGAVLVDAYGQCWMGGVNGWVIFDPERVSKIPRGPVRLNLSSARNYNERLGQWSRYGNLELLRPEGLVLAPHARTLSISFMLAALFNPQANRYSFYLEGHEPAWFHMGAVPVADYLDLSPGRYVFRVKARDHRGGLAANELVLPVTVLQVWYLRTWAILLWLLLASGAITLLVRMEFLRRLEHAEARRMRELDRFKDRFFANVTHEFRTPITVIQGLARQLETDRLDHEATRAKGVVIRRNGQRLLGLVDRILDLTRLEHHRMGSDKKPGYLLAYLRHTLPAYRSLAEVRGLRLDVEISGADLPVMFDAEQLGQIIDNLLGNALKFTPSGGIVSVKAVLQDEPPCILLLEVSDTGPGIKPADLPRIFDRFFQSSTNDRAATGGTGIGLALVKELVIMMGGTVVTGNGAGGGAVFTVRIPMDRAAADLPLPEVNYRLAEEVSPSPAQVDHEVPALNAPLILVVEDDVDVGDHISECIRGEYRVLRAMDGERGVVMAMEEIPDLIVSDVMMPGLDGFQLCEQLKTDPRTSHIPVALLTARSDQPSRLQGITRGADAYLAKPFDERELRGVLANLMRLRRGILEHYQTVWERSMGSAGPAAPAQVPSTSDHATPGSPFDGDIEDVFLIRLRDVLDRNHTDPDYSVERLADDLRLSRSQTFRKIKSLTGQPPLLLLRSFRLQKARGLLRKGGMNISEVAYVCGFSSPNYFSDAFLQVYGHRPSEVVKH
jgi:signal transduction histidine kinase/CheY-like chemotaxis protein/AraC-like DNA-binding protein